jgi:phosphoglycolate phosphatase
VFLSHGIEKITNDECKYFVGSGAEVLIRRALASKGITDEDTVMSLLSEYVSDYDKNPLHLTSVFPGIRETLSALSERGIRLAVLSNKPDSATKSIVASFFPNTFDAVYGQRAGVAMKPDPACADGIISDMGLSRSEVAFIGDTEVDTKTGRAVGVGLNIGVLWGFRKKEELLLGGADVTVSSADQIITEVMALD